MGYNLRYRKGVVGELQVSMERDGERIPIGAVQTWENQDQVVRFIHHVNRLLLQDERAALRREADRLAWK